MKGTSLFTSKDEARFTNWQKLPVTIDPLGSTALKSDMIDVMTD